jgi:hypothetical protein
MGEILNTPLQTVLRERRRRLNGLFLQARVTYPGLSEEAFLAHLRETVVPIAEKAYEADSSCIIVVLETLYEISLRLVAQGLMGPEASHPVIGEAWKALLCAHARHLCRDPMPVATGISNALIHLAGIDPSKATKWQETMLQLGTFAGTPLEWLKAGQVAAWRCGLAQYRDSAIKVAATLDPGLGARAIGLFEPVGHDAYKTLLDRMSRQPWVTPEEWLAGGPAGAELKLFAWTGGFIGYGGNFSTPPVPFVRDGRILLRDDSVAWCLEADCFGVALVRSHSDLPQKLLGKKVPMSVDKDCAIMTDHGRFTLKADFAESSYAADGMTVAIVPKDSHKVAVLGLRLPK